MRFKTLTFVLPLVVLFVLAPLVSPPRCLSAPLSPALLQPKASAPPKVSAQAEAPLQKNHGPVQRSKKAKAPREEPCREKAGIPENVFAQRKSIHESTRAQVQGVCSDTSLTEKQKREKIREIRKAAHEQSEALLTPAQREALRECQAARHRGGGSGGGHHGGVFMPGVGHHNGPCDEFR